jgi:sodium transport system ATP-binding protein
VEPGTAVALLGANGSGKTTLLRILATILTPDSGAASVAGFDVTREAGALRKNLGALLGARGGLYNRLTVRENLTYFARLSGLSREESYHRVEALARRFEVASLLEARTETLSTGMRQRVAVLRALVHRPRVLLLDEPSTGLDLAAAGELQNALRRIAESGTTMLIATHDLHLAGETCHRFLLLREGMLLRDDRIDGSVSSEVLRRALLAEITP